MLRACAEAAEASSEASPTPSVAKEVGILRSEDCAQNDRPIAWLFS